MQPQFITKPAFTVVGLLIHTTPMTPEIPQLWDQLVPRMAEIPHGAEPGVSYGLMDHYDNETGMFDYMAGNSVEKVIDLPAGLTRWDVPANTYAVFEATLPTLNEVFGSIYNTWLPTSDYQQADGPNFERYGETFNPADPAPKLEIYIPVKRKA
ncbi:MAG: AraC family transcriptional regulator [Anaerolineaceae bacterium]|nr:AraC family transcriptional regulator [Anaerolineaceae bacterium]MCB9099121.1 AraC family transcriptional regulator [Anaerolineales bacterium]